jgi:hypothetical protein
MRSVVTHRSIKRGTRHPHPQDTGTILISRLYVQRIFEARAGSKEEGFQERSSQIGRPEHPAIFDPETPY